MQSVYKIENLDKENDVDEYWQNIYEYIKKCREIKGIEFKEQPLSTFKKSYISWLNRGMTYLVWKNNMPAGTLDFEVLHKENLARRQVNFYNSLVDSEDLTDYLLKKIFEYFLAYDFESNYLYFKSENENNNFIVVRLLLKAYDIRYLYELNVSFLDKITLQNRLNSYEAEYSNYSLRFYKTLPEELMKPYCELYERICEGIPGNQDLNSSKLKEAELRNSQESLVKRGIYELRYLLYNKDEKLVGFTAVGINENRSETAYQHLTGLVESCRGIGLGKYLKLTMLLKLQNEYPHLKKLETEIHPENIISIKMNESFGYIQKGKREVYLVPRRKIEDWLKEN